MALPPNPFKDLIASTPEQTYNNFEAAGCLSRTGKSDRAGFVAYFQQAVAEINRELDGKGDGWTGPNLEDRLEGVLLDSPYLNRRAVDMARK